MIVGEGPYRYEVVEGWEQLPSGWSHGDVAGVATDSQDRVYVFNRSEHPVIVYDRDGKFLDTWGDTTTYPRPHGITIVDDIVYLVDDARPHRPQVHPGRQDADDARDVRPAV